MKTDSPLFDTYTRLRRHWRSLSALLFPSQCQLCHELLATEERLICKQCRAQLNESWRMPSCTQCGAPMSRGPTKCCAHCVHKPERAPWSAVLTVATSAELQRFTSSALYRTSENLPALAALAAWALFQRGWTLPDAIIYQDAGWLQRYLHRAPPPQLFAKELARCLCRPCYSLAQWSRLPEPPQQLLLCHASTNMILKHNLPTLPNLKLLTLLPLKTLEHKDLRRQKLNLSTSCS